MTNRNRRKLFCVSEMLAPAAAVAGGLERHVILRQPGA